MRLIDADRFQEELSNVCKWLVERDKKGYGTTHGECLDKIHDILSSQPTAYDVNKIVEQLEDEVTATKAKCPTNVEFDIGIYRAIEIVKAGRVNG